MEDWRGANKAQQAMDFSFLEKRLFEWMTSLMMLGIAVVVALDPATIRRGGFYLIENIALTPDVVGCLFTVFGALRLLALYVNGKWPVYGPTCRCLCALGGGILWAQMALALLEWSRQSNYISIGIPVYIFLAIGELFSCWRASSDMKSGKKVAGNGKH